MLDMLSMYLLRIRIVEAPSEKCTKCNWWLLLGEIREEMEIMLIQSKCKNIYETNTKRPNYKKMVIDSILSKYSQSAHKVCKEHWEGKR